MMHAQDDLITLQSRHSTDDTLARARAMLAEKGVHEFAVIDHSGEAARAGLAMPNTKVLLFGNPKGGTPLMLAQPSIAIDLPLRLLIREDAAGAVWVSYWPPLALVRAHGLAEEFARNLSILELLASYAAN